MSDASDLAANTIRQKIDADIAAKLSSWFENPEEAYALEDVREMHGKAL